MINKDNQHILGIFLIIIGGLFYLQNCVYKSFIPPFAHRNDFAHLYLGGFLAERGGNIYDAQLMLKTKSFLKIPTGLNPFVYPPFFAVLLIPLNKLSYDGAWLVFFVISQAAFFYSIFLIIKMLRREGESLSLWWGLLIAYSACFNPLPKTFTAGQMNTIILLCLVLGWYFFRRKQEWISGLILGLGTAVKLSPGFLLVYFLWKRQWRVVGGGVISLVLSLIISLSYLDLEIHQAFVNEAQQMQYGTSTWEQYGQHYHVEPHNQSPAAMWYRLLTENPSTSGITNSPGTAKVLSYLSALICFAALIILSYHPRFECNLLEYSLWCIGMLLLPSLMWDHYLVQMIFAIALASRMAFSGGETGKYILAISLGFMAIPFWFDNPILKSGWATLIISIKLFTLIGLFAYLSINQARKKNGSFTDFM